MNTKHLSALTLVASIFFAGHSFAEGNKAESEETKASSSITQPRDAASGLPTGKRQHKPLSVTKPIDKATPLLAKPPTDLSTKASGLPTGKRQHKPASLIKELDKSSPKSAESNYRLCPDGTMIQPGQKCPEKKARAGYKLCPDGSMINPGEKCPEKAKRR